MVYGEKKLKERQELKKEVRRRMKENAEMKAKEEEGIEKCEKCEYSRPKKSLFEPKKKN